MKHFFMEYGKIIVVGALTVTGLMFTTPFAEAVTGSVANFTTGMSSKYEPKELIDGDNVVLTDNDGDGVASKGDFLTVKASYLYSEGNTGPTEFLVLKSDGSTAELMAKTNYQTKRFNGTSGGATDSAGNTVLKYEGSELDTLLNETYYNTLSDTVKGKIRSQLITQYSWEWNGSTTEASSWYKLNFTSSTSSGNEYRLSRVGTVGTYDRNVYALDVQDVVNYLGTTFTPQQLNTMFFNRKSAQSGKNVWLRSAYSSRSYGAFLVIGSSGDVGGGIYDYTNEVRPAFTITLREGIF